MSLSVPSRGLSWATARRALGTGTSNRKRNACDVARTLGLFRSLAPPDRLKTGAGRSKSRGQRWARRLFRPTNQSPITNHLSLLTPSARAGDADPDNADANEPILRADGRVNAVHRADRSVHGHADDAHHANVDARE